MVQSCETYLSKNIISSAAYNSTLVVERPFNDAVDKLFQHALCAQMPSDAFRFVIYTELHVCINWS